MECPAGEAKDGVQVTVLREDGKHVSRLLSEKNVVRYYDSRAPSRLQRCEHVLNEVQLFVARLHDEIVAIRRLIRASRTKRWIRQNHIESHGRRSFINGVGEADVRLDLVEVEVHER